MVTIFIIVVIVSILAISTVYVAYRVKYMNKQVTLMNKIDQDYMVQLQSMNDSLSSQFETRNNANMTEAMLYKTMQEIKDVTVAGIKKNQNDLLSEATARERLDNLISTHVDRLSDSLTYEEAMRKRNDRKLFDMIVKEESTGRNRIDVLLEDWNKTKSELNTNYKDLRDRTMNNLSTLTMETDSRIKNMTKTHQDGMTNLASQYYTNFGTMSNMLKDRVKNANALVSDAVTTLTKQYHTAQVNIDDMNTRMTANFADWSNYKQVNDLDRRVMSSFQVTTNDRIKNAFSLINVYKTDIDSMSTDFKQKFAYLSNNDANFETHMADIDNQLKTQLQVLQETMTTNDTSIRSMINTLSNVFTTTIADAPNLSTQRLFVGPAPVQAMMTVSNNNDFIMMLPTGANASMQVRAANSTNPLLRVNANGVVSMTSNVSSNVITETAAVNKSITLNNQACIVGPQGANGQRLCAQDGRLTFTGNMPLRVDGGIAFGNHILTSDSSGIKVTAGGSAVLGGFVADTVTASTFSGVNGGPINIAGTLQAGNTTVNNASVNNLTACNIILNDRLGVGGVTAAQMGNAKLMVQGRATFCNNNTVVDINDTGVSIRTPNANQSALSVYQNNAPIFDVNNSKVQINGQLCFDDTCLTPAMLRVLTSLN